MVMNGFIAFAPPRPPKRRLGPVSVPTSAFGLWGVSGLRSLFVSLVGVTAAAAPPQPHRAGLLARARAAHLGPLKGTLDPVSFTIATFALCGFANLSSIGIQIGGIGALAPDRKHDLARLGFRAMIAGTLANFLSATLAGILL